MDDGWLSGSCGDGFSRLVGIGDRALMKTHGPIRPDWHCMACGDPWPCRVAQVTLEVELSDLRAVMTAYMAEAKTDLLDAALFVRFLGWVMDGRAVGSAPAARPATPRNRPHFD